MSQTGVQSTGSRRSARRKRSFLRGVGDTVRSWLWLSVSVAIASKTAGARDGCSVLRRFHALRKHQLEAALELLVARMFERGDRGGLVEEDFAADGAAAADLSGFAHQFPAAQEVG